MDFSNYFGALAGLASGDALGTTLEFRPPGSFEPITDMIGGGPFFLQPGQWTDDTSMALCLAESLAIHPTFDPRDQIERYLKWYRQGYKSSRDECFDIGNTVRAALERYEADPITPFVGTLEEDTAGNGSLMRLVPVAMRYARSPEQALRMAAQSSKITHGARACLDACRYFGGLLVGALTGVDRDTLLSPRYSPIPDYFSFEPLISSIDAIATGSFKEKEPPHIKGSGYVVHSLEAALWAFSRSEDFESGALLAVNLGDDADTTGAVYGQLAGAYYGIESIPSRWLEKLTALDEIESLSRALWDRAHS